MCFALLAIHQHPDYPFILAANRDEFFARPASPLHAWADEPGVVAGRDLESGGSWLALSTHDKRLVLVTNVRQGLPQVAGRSRGLLVRDLAATSAPLPDALQAVWVTRGDYAGFNLIAGQFPDRLYYLSNRLSNRHAGGIQPVLPGLYGLSNAALDTPWPKVLRGKAALAHLLQAGGAVQAEDLFTLLADTTAAPDHDLPDTGIGLERERWLSPLFIAAGRNGYGTRCSTVILMDRTGQVACHERTFYPDQRQETVHHFFCSA